MIATKSLIYRQKLLGDKTESWGMPELTEWGTDRALSTQVMVVLSEKKFHPKDVR